VNETVKAKDTKKVKGRISAGFASVAIPIIFIAAYCLFIFVLGNPQNFEGNNPANHPKPGNMLGTVYKGGIAVVPILMSLLLMVITFIIERFITIYKAKGKGKVNAFIAKVHAYLSTDDIENAKKACDVQKGSVANVVKAGLEKYQEMVLEKGLNRDQKTVAIKQEFEEATSLELPMLEQNLVILATISSIATLFGLLGTVLGMIRSFSAMATGGAPDAVGLANGISEALINTALGIGTSALAIIFYNYFTTQIDKMTYSIDEAGVAIVQNFAARHN
jgi:biopolymer transport protein ExbB